jgi:hypothetical protein
MALLIISDDVKKMPTSTSDIVASDTNLVAMLGSVYCQQRMVASPARGSVLVRALVRVKAPVWARVN